MRTGLRVTCGAIVLILASGFELHAQSRDHFLTVGSISGDLCELEVVLPIIYDNFGSDAISGWSFGVANEGPGLWLTAVSSGSTTLTVDGGGPPQFEQINLTATGFTTGVVISFTGENPLPPGSGYELNVASYHSNLDPGEMSEVCFTDTLGSPPVSTIVVVGGQAIVPTQTCGVVEVLPGPLPFLFTAHDVQAPSSGSFTTTVSILDQHCGTASSAGFSMALTNDPSVLVPVDVDPYGVIADIDPGVAFFGQVFYPDGWALVVVYSGIGVVSIQYPTDEEVAEVTYEVIGQRQEGDTTVLSWVNEYGTPPVSNVVVVSGHGEPAELVDGLVTFSGKTFLRGDSNADGWVDIADGVWILSELFLAGPPSPCPSAADVNGDGLLDTADASYLFLYRFLGGPVPAAPFPECGIGGELGPGVDCPGGPCP